MKAAIAILVLGAGLFAGSALAAFRFEGKSYETEKEALAAQQQIFAEALRAVRPAPAKIGGVLKIYVPDGELLRARMLPATTPADVAEYSVKSHYAHKDFMKAFFVRRGSFDSVEVVYGTAGHRKAEAPNHVLYFFAEPPGPNSWYFVNGQVPSTAVPYGKGSSQSGEQMTQFVESVEALAKPANSAKPAVAK